MLIVSKLDYRIMTYQPKAKKVKARQYRALNAFFVRFIYRTASIMIPGNTKNEPNT